MRRTCHRAIGPVERVWMCETTSWSKRGSSGGTLIYTHLVGLDKELRTIGVSTTVGHGNETPFVVLHFETLVFERFTKNAFGARPIVVHKVTACMVKGRIGKQNQDEY